MVVGDDGQAAIGAAAMRKVMWRIIPLILVAYLFAYMDRVNVSFAATDMNADLGFSATVYGLGGGLFFLGYALFEIPSNLMLVRVGARPWIARIMVTWGLLSAGMMFVQTPMQFYVLRFLLGVAEAGFFPGVITYFALWFPPCHRSRAVSRFYIAVPLASVVMGAVSGWLLSLHGTGELAGWQWLFLAQGLPTVLVGLAVLLWLPDRPDTVTWLTDEERDWIIGELAREQRLIGGAASHNIFAVLGNPRVLMFGAIGFLGIGASTAFALSMPMILAKGTGFSTQNVGLLVSAGGIVGALVMLRLGQLADRRSDRFIAAFWCYVLLGLAYLTICLSGSWLLVVLAFLVHAACAPSAPMLASSAWGEALPARDLAVGAAAINTISQIGSFATPVMWGMMADRSGGFAIGLVSLAALALAAAALIRVLRAQVRTRALRAAAA